MVILFRDEVLDALRWQGIRTEGLVGVLGAHRALEAIQAVIPGATHALTSVTEAVRAARSSRLVALVVELRAAEELVEALGSDAESVGIVAMGDLGAARPRGVLAVVEDPTWDDLFPPLRRSFELRALHTLEHAHRCEAKRISRREHELLGEPPETLSDDLELCHPPPLPVGPTSSYDLESLADAFEQAYVERVQLLSESIREAAEKLDVSSATLGRRKRRDT
ncbi:MAG: hypothetical protein HY791_12780 [Deltaproteobacteria bacterium]|nr:hypothetical protein [Deltaproteobacteria bacterium]